jgi:hypothetical protein
MSLTAFAVVHALRRDDVSPSAMIFGCGFAAVSRVSSE